MVSSTNHKRSREPVKGDSEQRVPKSQKTHHKSRVQALDDKHPETWPKVHIPPYTPTSTTSPSPQSIPYLSPDGHRSSLPPLPPITDPALADAPFVHSSAVDSKYSASTLLTYERLEFLGDAYIEIIATRIIFSRFPSLLTGRQAQLREQMVRNSTLASYARAYGLEARVRSAPMEKGREKIAADVFEAYVAAVVLSDPAGGFATAEAWLTGCWTEFLLRQDDRPITTDLKTELHRQVWVRGVRLEYRSVAFNEKSQVCDLEIHMTGWESDDGCIGKATGKGKTDAGMRAARAALDDERLMDRLRAKKRRAEEKRKAAMALAEAVTETEVTSKVAQVS